MKYKAAITHVRPLRQTTHNCTRLRKRSTLTASPKPPFLLKVAQFGAVKEKEDERWSTSTRGKKSLKTKELSLDGGWKLHSGDKKDGKELGGISNRQGDCIGAIACYLILTAAAITIKQTRPQLFSEQLALVWGKWISRGQRSLFWDDDMKGTHNPLSSSHLTQAHKSVPFAGSSLNTWLSGRLEQR